jgi:hypothetical protein
MLYTEDKCRDNGSTFLGGRLLAQSRGGFCNVKAAGQRVGGLVARASQHDSIYAK